MKVDRAHNNIDAPSDSGERNKKKLTNGDVDEPFHVAPRRCSHGCISTALKHRKEGAQAQTRSLR
jgi:hypothetical protein